MDGRITDKLERIWKEKVIARSRYHPAFALMGSGKP
jgi:hypothetical protein